MSCTKTITKTQGHGKNKKTVVTKKRGLFL